ncbi:MAG: type IV secretion system protein, partial [Candidatus Vogelbacteria bacterium]|nr:type IV secretion system protein [Candidatus Vogelbacteria bacterium]
EVRLQRLQTDIDYIRRQLQDPSLTPERRQELEAQLASKQQEIRSGGRTQDANKQAALAAATGKCGWTTFWNCVPELISAVGEFFKQIFGLGLWLAGKFFDKSAEYSITTFSTLANSASVQIGWKTLRDLANLFFIFILLYAAIGMILQLPSINGKRILVTVIVIALLINFSAFFTRIVIDASNVAAAQFYNAVSKSETARIGVGEGQLEISGISATFMNALPIQSVLASAPGRGIINAIGLSFGAVIMMLVAIFVFLTAAILFVVRTVTLLFVIILSPLAFLMYAFPNQKGLFDKWLDTLLKQAFFAPLYLLMVWVTIKFLKGGALEQILAQGDASPVLITLNFLVAIGFMLGALIIAKSLGAKGASAAVRIGKKWAGYGAMAAYTPIRGIGRGIKHRVQTGLGQLEAGKGRIGGITAMKKLISAIPYARAGMQRAAGAYRAEVAKKGEDFSRLRTSEMIRRLGQTGIFPTTRMAMLQAIAKKDDLDEVPIKELQRARELMKQVGVSTTAMEKLRPDAGENPADIEKMVARHKQPDIAKLHRVIVSGEGANDVVDKDDQGKDITRRDALISAMINQYDGGSANAVIRRGDAISDAFLTKLLERANAKAGTKIERSSEQIIKYLEEDVLKPINDKLTQKQGQIKQIETIPETQKTRGQKEELRKEIDNLRVQAGKIASHARSYTLGNTKRDAGLDEFAGKKGPGSKTTPPAPANQPGAPAGGTGI